jgi:hypothetical protein
MTYQIAYLFPNGVFIYLEIMLSAFGFLYINDVLTGIFSARRFFPE